MRYSIEYNSWTRGYKCNFSHRGKKYYATLCAYGSPAGEIPKCMIFREDRWGEVYCKRHIPVSPEQLAACIDEFVKGADHDDQ